MGLLRDSGGGLVGLGLGVAKDVMAARKKRRTDNDRDAGMPGPAGDPEPSTPGRGNTMGDVGTSLRRRLRGGPRR
jgi:hypothetical protein